METLKQANYAIKTESVKNRTACSERIKKQSVPPKILKFLQIIGMIFFYVFLIF
jgi:hypothetical protein